jgi:hypothetical protein
MIPAPYALRTAAAAPYLADRAHLQDEIEERVQQFSSGIHSSSEFYPTRCTQPNRPFTLFNNQEELYYRPFHPKDPRICSSIRARHESVFASQSSAKLMSGTAQFDYLIPYGTTAVFSSSKKSLCKQKIPRHIKLAIHAWSTKCR